MLRWAVSKVITGGSAKATNGHRVIVSVLRFRRLALNLSRRRLVRVGPGPPKQAKAVKGVKVSLNPALMQAR